MQFAPSCKFDVWRKPHRQRPYVRTGREGKAFQTPEVKGRKAAYADGVVGSLQVNGKAVVVGGFGVSESTCFINSSTRSIEWL